MKWISIALIALALAACSGEPAGPAGKGGAAATACDAFVKNKLEGKLYTLDINALAASMKEGTESSANLTSAIVIEPGLTTEVKQTIQCDIRFNAEGNPEVLNINFIW